MSLADRRTVTNNLSRHVQVDDLGAGQHRGVVESVDEHGYALRSDGGGRYLLWDNLLEASTVQYEETKRVTLRHATYTITESLTAEGELTLHVESDNPPRGIGPTLYQWTGKPQALRGR